MATMYEMIMDLPLFKGVSKTQVSQFLEKTNIDFLNYESGDTIVEKGKSVNMVKFVISGAARIVHDLDCLPIKIIETCGHGIVLGADRLFGISTGYAYEAVAEGKTSIMQFSKEQYINLLHSDRIYMLNFFNYLSLRAQRHMETVSEYAKGDLRSRLSMLLNIMTLPTSTTISIISSDEALSQFAWISKEEVMEWKNRAADMGLISIEGDKINILSRSVFLS